jgi:hypothetical protein
VEGRKCRRERPREEGGGGRRRAAIGGSDKSVRADESACGRHEKDVASARHSRSRAFDCVGVVGREDDLDLQRQNQ